MFISEKVKNITPSPTLAIDAKAKKMKKEGIDIISFGAGEPDFDTPENIKAEGINAIQRGQTKYTPVSGLIELKEAICGKFKKDNGLTYSTSNIVVSCGAKHSLYNVFQCILNPGDEVIIPVPYWVSYTEMVKLAQGKPVFINTQEKSNFIPSKNDLLSKITSRTKAIIINSPNNPSGMIYTREDMEVIGKIAIEKNILIISDEIYEKLIYDGNKHVSIAELGEEIKRNTVIVNGVSKTYAMTGWRIGYIACEEKLAKACDNLQSHSTSNPCSISQYASIEALQGSQDKVNDMLSNFDIRRKLMVKGLNNLPEIKCKMPNGAFYAFPDISGLFGKTYNSKKLSSSTDVADFFLEAARVAVVQGSAFGMDTHLRLSYAASLENIEKGLIRMMEVLKKE
ncbi:MAG: pyridoxal phosphate-dependent aminotransferase [Candidatus Firestonebacteria bacterium]|nr:pyridoxal phosphate-dependent aminotransferase [Candidatus Firestonebacteria bacterium]